MEVVMLRVIPSFIQIIQKAASLILQTHMKKFVVRKVYCIARHDDKMCFLPTCSYNVIFLGNIKELLQILDAFFFNYHHVDCPYTLFKYRFSGKNCVRSGQLFDNLQRAIQFNHHKRGVERMPSIAKNRLLRKKYKTSVEILRKDQIDAI